MRGRDVLGLEEACALGTHGWAMVQPEKASPQGVLAMNPNTADAGERYLQTQ